MDYNYVPAAPVRRKPVVKGIVGFSLSIGAIALSILCILYAILAVVTNLSIGHQTGAIGVSTAFSILVFVFGAIGLGLSIPAFILSTNAMAVHASAPEHYTLLGMYKAGKVIGMIDMITVGIAIVLAIFALL